ncbi:MAG: potassium transporter TrkA [Euryarchaeota archaeon]|nr:potassium transporter TrkA [Euryarchaeota archaeon]
MLALISLLLVILFSIIFTRVGAVALEITGISRDVAAFQAQSAYTGVGFTTSESEYVVSHPLRRKIIRVLMFVGSAGIASAIAMLFLTFSGNTQEEAIHNIIYLGIGVALLFIFGRSKLVDRALRYVILGALKRFTKLRVYDYELLLGIRRGYAIGEILVRENNWLVNRRLRDLRLNEEGVLVLGIERKKGDKIVYIGAPRGDTEILEGDRIICYGPEEVIENLSRRIKGKLGDEEHRRVAEKEKKREMIEKIESE